MLDPVRGAAPVAGHIQLGPSCGRAAKQRGEAGQVDDFPGHQQRCRGHSYGTWPVVRDVTVDGQSALGALGVGLHTEMEAVIAVLIDEHRLHVQYGAATCFVDADHAPQPDLVAVREQRAQIDAGVAG